MVISWSDENEGQEPGDGGQMVIADPALLEAGSDTSDESIIMLFFLARIGNWDELLVRLHGGGVTPEEIRNATGPLVASEYGENILHIVVSNSGVPLTVVQAIVDLDASSPSEGAPCVVMAQNDRNQTPLHLAVMNNSTRPDLIRCLYDSNPESVKLRDDRQLRPIDEITTKIIMMEEVLKYSQENDKPDYKQKLSYLWETAAVLVGAEIGGNGPREEDLQNSVLRRRLFIVHACIRSREVPFALTERAMKYNSEQMTLPDENGDLPLHIICRVPPRVQPAREEEEAHENQDDDEGDFLERVLCLNPNAATCFNNDQQIPLVVAIESGRLWRSGCLCLLEAHPDGILETRLPSSVYPYLLERLLAERPDTAYRMVQSMTDIFREGDKLDI